MASWRPAGDVPVGLKGMDRKYLEILEYPKIIARLAEYTSFSAGRELAEALSPSSDLDEVKRCQRETTEAKRLLDVRPDITLGGARDVRSLVRNACLGIALDPLDLLGIRNTCVSAQSLRRILLRLKEDFPLLADMAEGINECPRLVAEITRCISDRGEVVDAASPALGRIRREMNIAHDRLVDRLNRMITSPEVSRYLQDALVTLRSGRYVIPLRAEFKGRIPGLVHDQSSSGATLFIEPLATVELNNQWRELQLQEEREVKRILHELSALVAESAEVISRLVEILASLDLAFAKARYSQAMRGIEPTLISLDRLDKTARSETATEQPSAIPPGVCIWLRQARHPLLPAETVVPIDVHLGGDFSILVITGPNTGGKTVALKTVGLLTAMAQAGLHLPAREDSAVAVFDGVYADIGDEQSIEQSLSTFSSHMTNIIDIAAHANERSLALLDELGAGTDPVEGSALARAILSYFLGRRIPVMATTHYSELKIYAHSTPGVQNASVEFDVETLAPTFKLTIGLPGRSNALAIAGRLGLGREIIDDARELVSDEALQADQMLGDIKRAREEALSDREAARTILRSARRLEQEWREKNAGIEKARQEMLNTAREEARRELDVVRRQLRQLSNRLASDALTREWLAQAKVELDKLTEGVQPILPALPPVSPTEAVALKPGDMVWIPSLQQGGELLLLDGMAAEVGIGKFRVRVRAEELERMPEVKKEAQPAQVRGTAGPLHPSPGIELDLRGWRVEDVLPRLDKYLDDAYLAGLPWVRIIHGKGTGTLRRVVREKLSDHPLVAGYRAGEQGEGGEGVTIANLVRQEE